MAEMQSLRRWRTDVTMRDCHVDPIGWLAYRWGQPAPPVSPSFECWFSTTLRIVSTPFIQVGLIRGLRIDTLAYIYQPLLPPSRRLQYVKIRSEIRVSREKRIELQFFKF